jgi:ribosomal protein S18 acetylase RimI-like enzyme
VPRVNVRVRPAEAGDVPALVALTRGLDQPGGAQRGPADGSVAHLAQRFAELVADPLRHVLVCVDEATGVVGGLLMARQDEVGAIDLTPVLHVTHLIVDPGQRKRGIGRALLAAAVHLADDAGADRMMATVASSSREGNRYLARLGFAPLVTHRVAQVAVVRRGLGLSETAERMALLRRTRLARAQRAAEARGERLA